LSITYATLESFVASQTKDEDRQLDENGLVPSPKYDLKTGFIPISHGEKERHVYRTNLFARHNLFLATPVMPLASPACDSARPQDLSSRRQNHFALASSQPTTLPNPVSTRPAISKTAMPDGRTRTLTGLRRLESQLPREASEASTSLTQILRRSL
jgi:hypothetical protein